MLPADDDASLVAALVSGDERALAALVTRHAGRVRGLALRFTGDAAEADEVVQDVFLRVWQEAWRFEPARARFTTWLYRIAANRSLDAVRRRRRWAWLGLGDGLDAATEQASAGLPADEALGERQEVAATRRDIAALPERQRLAIVLVAGGDCSAAEVADILGLSRGAAEQLIVRARRTLRDRLRERVQR